MKTPPWIQPLLSGRGWTPSLRAMYHRQVGEWLTCGIEVELHYGQFVFDWTRKSGEDLLAKLHENGGENWEPSFSSSVPEYTCLFDLTDPVRLRESVRQHYLAMIRVGFSFAGALHVNYVVEIGSAKYMDINKADSRMHDDFEVIAAYKMRPMTRIEFKGGRPTMIWEDLLLQIVLGITTRGDVFRYNFALQNSAIVKALPKSRRAYTIFG